MEKLLLFHINGTEQKKIIQAARSLHIRCDHIADQDYGQPLERLVTGRKDPLIAPYTKEAPAESLLLMCGLADRRIDDLLAALRRADVQIDYKAVLTPANRTWNVLRLLLEMRAEKAAYAKQTGLFQSAAPVRIAKEAQREQEIP